MSRSAWLYAEAVSDPGKARELVGTNLLDREIARRPSFGDPRRLQARRARRHHRGDAGTRHITRADHRRSPARP